MKLLVTDPSLAKACAFDICTPYQYRLHGPGRWDGARDAIMTQWDRIYYPTHKNQCRQEEKKFTRFKMFVIISSVAASVLIFKFNDVYYWFN